MYPEQKIFCKPESINDTYRCLLMVEFSDLIIENYAFIYAKSQNSILNMYGNFINMKYFYDEFYENLIYKNMPDEEAKFNNIVNNKLVDFIFINNIDNYKKDHYYFYLCVYSNG